MLETFSYFSFQKRTGRTKEQVSATDVSSVIVHAGSSPLERLKPTQPTFTTKPVNPLINEFRKRSVLASQP
jgi:hypothetical protein